MSERKYVEIGPGLYMAIGSAFADGFSISLLGESIIEGKLEKILLWGGITLVNSASCIGNYLLSVKSTNNKKLKKLKFKRICCLT